MVHFVSADWVSDHIEQPGYLIIDPRSAMRYLMGHLRGAVNVPFKKLRGPDGLLGQPEQLAAVFGEAGLGDGIAPVLYDHEDGRNASMAAWVLEYLGLSDVYIMDILYDAWKEQGREVLYRPVSTEPKSLSPRLNPSVRATTGELVEPGETKLLDTRSPEEFLGQTEIDHRPGHIPGAVNVPHSEMAGADGKLLIEPDLLRRRLAAAGITPGDPVVAYCRTGVRASLAYLSMQHAGYNVRLYDGSYAEWMDSGHTVEVCR